MRRLLLVGLTCLMADESFAEIPLPFGEGETWYVCRGYNVATHAGPALDLTITSNSWGPSGCNSGANDSAGRIVRAPKSGQVGYYAGDMLCLSFDDGSNAMLIGHFASRVPEGHVDASASLGTLSSPGETANGDYAHIHMQIHRGSSCTSSTLIPFDEAHGTQLEDDHNMYDGGNIPSQWKGTKLTKAAATKYHPPGSLIRKTGDPTVYWLNNNQKRGISSPDIMAANGWTDEDVIVVKPEEFECYNTGEPVPLQTLNVKAWNGHKDGSLVRDSATGKVHVIKDGVPYHLQMPWQEFISAGYNPENIEDVSGIGDTGNFYTFAQLRDTCAKDIAPTPMRDQNPQRTSLCELLDPFPFVKRLCQGVISQATTGEGLSTQAASEPCVEVVDLPPGDIYFSHPPRTILTLGNGNIVTIAGGALRGYTKSGEFLYEKSMFPGSEGIGKLEGDTLLTIGCDGADAFIFHIDPDTGQEKKRIPFNFRPVNGCPGGIGDYVFHGGLLYLAAAMDAYGVNQDTGEKVWQWTSGYGWQTERRFESSQTVRPAVGPDGTFYIPSVCSVMYVLSKDGVVKGEWKMTNYDDGPGGCITPKGGPIIDSDGSIYLSFHNIGGSGIISVNPDGNKRFFVPDGTALKALGKDLFYGWHNGLRAYRKDTGEEAWTASSIDGWTVNFADASVTLGADETVYVLTYDLFALRGSDGALLWRMGKEFEKYEHSPIGITAKNGLAFVSCNPPSQPFYCQLNMLGSNMFTLEMSIKGKGRVTSTPPLLDCSTDCAYDAPKGTVLNFHATPDPGWQFDGFTGEYSCESGGVGLDTMDRHCIATFTKIPNQLPVVSAGADQEVNEGEVVTLQGSASDPEGDLLNTQWTQTLGEPVILSDPGSLTPTFSAPQVGVDSVFTFQLEVSDGVNPAITSMVNVTVSDVAVAQNLVATLIAKPPTSRVGRIITVIMKVKNESGQALTLPGPTLNVNGTGDVTLVKFPLQVVIPKGGSKILTWRYRVLQAGVVFFSGKAMGAQGESPMVTSNDVTIN